VSSRWPAAIVTVRGLGGLRHGDREGQHTLLVPGLDVVGVEGLAEEQLAGQVEVDEF
jgi:hypothetical protein